MGILADGGAILAVNRKSYYQLALSWGVLPLLNDMQSTTEELFASAIEKAENTALFEPGDILIMTSGWAAGTDSETNTMRVYTV